MEVVEIVSSKFQKKNIYLDVMRLLDIEEYLCETEVLCEQNNSVYLPFTRFLFWPQNKNMHYFHQVVLMFSH